VTSVVTELTEEAQGNRAAARCPGSFLKVPCGLFACLWLGASGVWAGVPCPPRGPHWQVPAGQVCRPPSGHRRTSPGLEAAFRLSTSTRPGGPIRPGKLQNKGPVLGVARAPLPSHSESSESSHVTARRRTGGSDLHRDISPMPSLSPSPPLGS
jgi:hypothetical protein